jgi:hypothetical protein
VRRHGPNKVCEKRHDVFGPHGMLYIPASWVLSRTEYVQYAASQAELVLRTKRRRSQRSAVLRASERTPRNYE